MLYDTTADVIRKALRGLDLAPSTAATRSDLAERDVISAARDSAPEDLLVKLAPALGLGSGALAHLSSYTPPDNGLPQITRLELPFGDETVNAWLVSSAAGPLLFDTGDGRDDVRLALEKLGIGSVDVFITHEHGDHTGGLRGLSGKTGRLAGPMGSEPLRPGDTLSHGELSIRVVDLPGHCDGALGYVIEGLAKPICVTGDALFAGSIGGCAPGVPYLDALVSIRKEVLSLSTDTIILPGHGPATSVAAELQSNPFFAVA